ncbi:MAG TPA: NAD(P)/FAD-dependent oxidoreductase [Thermoplasmata archaeon]|nr:NAD(P)/FAD-dependent oxidoreductase [Thermoplasmata archaeon]
MPERPGGGGIASYDAVVIGAGHNGLVAANYLAKAGLRVVVVERSDRVGGACVTDEIAPGFKVNAAAYVSGLFRPQIIEDLGLTKYGLRQIAFDPQAFCPFPDGRYLLLWSDVERTCKEIARFSTKDAEGYRKYAAFWDSLYELIEPMLLSAPVPIADLAGLMRGADAEELLRRLLFFSAKELLDEFFESPEVKTALANQSIIGHFAGPSTPCTAFTLSHNLLGNVDGVAGAWGFTVGGMGEIPSALAKAALAHGVDIRLNTGVERILTHHGRVTGVRLPGGRVIAAKAVVSSADPKRTFLSLVDPDALPPEFLRAVQNIKIHGAAMKVNCALSELPDWKALPGGSGLQHRGSTYICPSIEYAEAAFEDAKRGIPSQSPWMEAVTQSVLDPSVAPPGRHTLSIYVQYTPYRLLSDSWDDLRDSYADRVIETLAEYAPNVPRAVVARQILTPLDLERRFGLTEAHQAHGEMGPDQSFSFRPVPGWSNYRMPVRGLYLCGAGTHPGGGVMGAPGYNGAHAVLEDWNRLKE